ncbi:DUF2623 family protein [Pseudomonas sp. LJDD11]|uniref:DUF2623 family protein n=1 Tax=Pseudomonas sp. LJDD11 TaxID=2931984 RepID=UPI00211CBC84|nr:DUF2623 family protein [Pseudomonas sp. LJDD11]MCQ9422727.1 DUF2623 family protein [Pseudomonas sp. LJDD11]
MSAAYDQGKKDGVEADVPMNGFAASQKDSRYVRGYFDGYTYKRSITVGTNQAAFEAGQLCLEYRLPYDDVAKTYDHPHDDTPRRMFDGGYGVDDEDQFEDDEDDFRD